MDIDIGEVLMVIPRCLGSIIFLFFITKIMGKKQVSQFSLFDYVIGISIGNFTAEMTLNTEVPYISGMAAVATFGVLSFIVTKMVNKNIRIRRFIIGTPTVLVDDGRIIEKGLKRVNIDINDLLEDCRIAGYFDIQEIAYAIMEANGSISFLPKGQYKNPTMEDMKLKSQKSYLSANIIVNGEYMEEAIKKSKINKKQLIAKLKKIGMDSPDDVLLATITDTELQFYLKDEPPKNYSLLE